MYVYIIVSVYDVKTPSEVDDKRILVVDFFIIQPKCDTPQQSIRYRHTYSNNHHNNKEASCWYTDPTHANNIKVTPAGKEGQKAIVV